MTRESFLLDFWRRYPAADASWIDVAQFCEQASGEALVCGRLRRTSGEAAWVLEAAGVSCAVGFANNCGWLEAQTGVAGESQIFDPALLRDGDLVCLKLERAVEGGPAKASACCLLVPAEGSYRLRSRFDFMRSKQWADFMAEVREFFRMRNFIEVQTPTLVPSPGTEPFLDPFSSLWENGREVRMTYLPTSPEFHLKKMLVAGWTRLFEFKPCFRNGELSSHHQPEFLMLEWYRAYAPLTAIGDDVEALLAWLSARLGSDVTHRPPPLQRTTMARVFATAFPGFELRPDTSREELLALAKGAEVSVGRDDSWDEIFFRIFLEKIEPRLGEEGPVLLHGFPPSQAALARIGADGFADRFEIYWRGFEIANAFHELNDPKENENRFHHDAAKKAALGKPPVPFDKELVRALHYGLPPSGGIALGLDRLFMAFYGLNDLADARAFPFDAADFARG